MASHRTQFFLGSSLNIISGVEELDLFVEGRKVHGLSSDSSTFLWPEEPDAKFSWQNRRPAARAHLEAPGATHLHLMFVAQVYKEQVDNARHAHIKQPERALN